MDSWFGMERLTQFLIAFAIVLALIAVFFWLWRRLAGNRIGGGTTRGRQPRLAVIDAAAIDGRRRLVLIRRDNVEHLLMIGGPSDVVIEQNIVRAVPVAAARETAGSRGDAAPRLPEIAPPRVETAPAWPLQPEPVQRHDPEPGIRPQRAPRVPEPEPPPMVRPLRTVEPEPVPRGARMAEPEPVPRPGRVAEPEPALPRHAEPMPRAVASAEPMSRPAAPERPPFRVPPPSAKATAEPLRAIEPRPAPATQEDNLADMAQRLEAALRRPRPPSEDRGELQVRPAPSAEVAPPARDAPRMEPAREAPRMEPPQRAPAPEPARAAYAEPKPDARPTSPKSVLDSLEQEMASLLGRPSGKE